MTPLPFALRLLVRLCTVAFALLAGCGLRPPAVAPLVSAARTNDPPIEVLLVGTFHFNQTDTLRYDVLSPERKPQVDAVVDALVRWAPDKLFLEWQPEFNQALADSLVDEHRRTGPLRRRNEVYQLGIRTAVRLGHPRVYLMDHPGRFGALFEPMRRFAEAHAQQDILGGTAPYTRRAYYEVTRSDDDSVRMSRTLAAYLQTINAPRALADDHAVFVARYARVGEIRTDLTDTTGEASSGAELVADWYRRNVHMYAKVLKWMTFRERRIVIVVGSSHVPIMRHLFETHGGFRVTEVADVLPRR